MVGGPALETAIVELLIDGELSRRREIDLDGAGLLVASLSSSLLEGSDVRLRVTAPVLGPIELDPRSDTSALPGPPGEIEPAERPAPPLEPVGARQPMSN